MNIPKSYEALAADLASEKIISKTLQGQKESYMMLADGRKFDLDAIQQRMTVAEQRADDMVYALARIQGRAEMFIDDGMHMPTPSIEAIRDISAKAALKPAAQHHGDPVAWQYRVSAGPATGWSLWHDGKGEEFKNSYQVETRPLYAEHPAPVADHTQCEECKGWGYHENHHEGGGTECGECGGSGNAPVAVVMPGRMYSDSLPSWAEEQKLVRGWNACLEEVARLNVVKI